MSELWAGRESTHGLNNQGLSNYRTAYWNLEPAALYEHSLKAGTAELAEGGALVVMTGEHTGRAPKDKFIVDEPSSQRPDLVGRGQTRGCLRTHFDEALRQDASGPSGRAVTSSSRTSSPAPSTAYRLAVRVVSESPWHSLFAHNMFLIPGA